MPHAVLSIFPPGKIGMNGFENHPDRLKWNEKYLKNRLLPASLAPRLAPQPLLEKALLLAPPGAVLELACGLGGNALWLAAGGREVCAADISDVALATLAEAAAARGLAALINCCQADLTVW